MGSGFGLRPPRNDKNFFVALDRPLDQSGWLSISGLHPGFRFVLGGLPADDGIHRVLLVLDIGREAARLDALEPGML